MQAPPRLSARHFTSLDGLRGIAFLLVFAHHYGLASRVAQPFVQGLGWVSEGGWMGVDLFFVLSGFLITGILLDTRDGPHYYRNFYARRALRILPLYYTLLLVLLALTPVWHLDWRWGHLAYFFYFGNIAGHADATLNTVQPFVNLTHTWSLAVEEQFYLVWPLIVASVPSPRKLVRLCILLSVCGLLLRILLLLTVRAAYAQEWAYGELPTHADGLLMGAVAAVLFRRFDLPLLLRKSRPLLLAAAAAAFALVAYGRTMNYHNPWMTLAIYPAIAVLFACLLLRTLQPGHLANRIGQWRFLRFFGRYSYGMYLFHEILSPMTGRWMPWLQLKLRSQALGGFAYVGLVFLATIVVSVASFELYEKHWLRLKSRFSYAREPKPLAEAS